VADDDAASTSHLSRGFYRSLRRPRIWGVSFGVIIMAVCTVVALRVAIGFAINNEDEDDVLQRWKDKDDVPLRWKASNGQIPGLTYDEERSWRGPFFFVLGADSQLGLIDQMNNITVNPSWTEELRRLDLIISRLNSMDPKPKFFIICGDLVNAFPEKFPERWERQGEDLKKSLLRLDPSIPAICVCGNHDIGNQPTKDAIARYRGSFGDDYFSFWVGGTLFVVLNTQYYKDDTLVPDLSLAQESWLDSLINSTSSSSPRHVVAFLHIAPFKTDVDEPEEWFNLAIEKRMPLLHKLFNAGVKKIFCGHFHQNSGGFAFERRLEVVVNSAIGRVWAGKPGVRIVKVGNESIHHKWFDLDQIPEVNIEL